MTDDIVHLDADLNVTGVSRPCPAKALAPFWGTDATYLGCGLLLGHDEPHLFQVQWTDDE